MNGLQRSPFVRGWEGGGREGERGGARREREGEGEGEGEVEGGGRERGGRREGRGKRGEEGLVSKATISKDCVIILTSRNKIRDSNFACWRLPISIISTRKTLFRSCK